ncbi:MAG: D-tyrosyl-tRNA(Tyr) deacylase [Chloroflexi bacterium]|nr:MAG: D-tyrosyl-tRNA(Tyr) deacylase [Chloroflexi bacterium 13_1_20CM_2_70_9]TME98277.1 MAG: D-tyrosyl-tRNA(Tyr) deacylase [Chloroflexota bacterium]TMG37195.1 MAG: D-tyrosyl-tRNA(Tyr) deacylase [Chloroflexota bacterium]TMG41854.1 MAG: D-tyrosyl-tRNA(Tyr) deacylase [Chloroflexota bacterium]
MRAVVQRVRSAAVHVGDERVARIDRGLVVLLGVAADDRAQDGERLATKVAGLRVFDDERGKMARAVADIGGAILVIPQFTLYGDARHGRRPDFTAAAPPDVGRRLYDAFCGVLRGKDLAVEQGRFGALMRVVLEADGPVTLVLSTDGWAQADLGRA